jgi:transcriptional antiterminator RfaH
MWYAVHTKPREELRALDNLSRQGFECFLPLLGIEKIVRGRLKAVTEPMFSRYLFVKSESENQNFSLIRSTKGVNKLLSFGALPCEVPDKIIEALMALATEQSSQVQTLFKPGDSVMISDGPLKGLCGVFKEANGDLRAFILLELLNKTHAVEVQKAHLIPAQG